MSIYFTSDDLNDFTEKSKSSVKKEKTNKREKQSHGR